MYTCKETTSMNGEEMNVLCFFIYSHQRDGKTKHLRLLKARLVTASSLMRTMQAFCWESLAVDFNPAKPGLHRTTRTKQLVTRMLGTRNKWLRGAVGQWPTPQKLSPSECPVPPRHLKKLRTAVHAFVYLGTSRRSKRSSNTTSLLCRFSIVDWRMS